MTRLEFARSHKPQTPKGNYKHETAMIHASSVIGGAGFGYVRNELNELEFIYHNGNVSIGANVQIRAFCTVDRATLATESTVIEEGTKIDHHCHIAHNVKLGKHNTLANGCIIEGSCVVGDYNTFGTGVIVQRKVKVGNNCVFGSGSVVTKDVPDNSVMIGNPARLWKQNA